MVHRYAKWVIWISSVALSSVVSTIATAPEALAQASSPKDAARAMAERGQQLLLAGRPAEALVELRNADATYHAPTIVLLIARAHAELGQNEQAYNEYTRVVDEQLPESAPPEWKEARRLAMEERAAIASRIALLTITIQGSGLQKLTIDRVAVSAGRAIAVRPGSHVVEWSSPAGSGSLEVQARAGSSQTMTVSLAAGAARPTLSQNAGSGGSGEDALPWLITGIIAAGLGAAGIGVGIGEGVVAMNLTTDLESSGQCRDGVCLGSAQDDYDAASSAATVSTGAFIAGGALLAAGAAFLTIYFVSDDTETATLRANVGAGGAGLTATWRFQ